MCELLGMSANVPTDICFSFSGLLERGGRTGPHKDGWGIGFYEGKGFRSFIDPEPCCDSVLARLIKDYPMKSNTVISHIRQANSGGIKLENTHPFSRELWGKHWCYAHNGQLKQFESLPCEMYSPVGETDSEHAFCWLLSQISQINPDETEKCDFAFQMKPKLDHLRSLGVFNMLMSDSVYLYAYCTTKLSWITRRAPFGEAKLKDVELQVDFGTETTPNDVVTVVATEPLTHDEEWHQMKAGELVVFRQGELVCRVEGEA
ncbi:class II glutamine amidotransferase [Litoribacillus peritrichatus]|uniref:Class II glutamine amidotransferase n=1 Tax=Litoribacillus peritrichatus TaxID=718191 RepID=A0ABP7N5K2_9GAMM